MPHEDAPPLPGDEAGNIICRIPATEGEAGTPILFCAHIDTVEPTAPIEPVLADGVVTNACEHHPRRRQQGGRGLDARGHPARSWPRAARTPASS